MMQTVASTRLADLLGGAALAGLLLPEAVAYSGLAGLPPQAGIIGLFAGLICYGLIGRSRYAIVSATSSSAAVLAAATLALAADDPAQRLVLASLLVAGAGVAFLLAGALRLGAMSNLIARPVLRGFAFGLALVIVLKQWPHLVGMQVHASHFAALLVEIVRAVDSWQLASLGCGLAALAVLFLFERFPRIPGALVVIIGGIAAMPLLAAHGVAATGPISLAITLTSFSLPPAGQWLELSEVALALMFILYAESYGSIRTFSLQHNEAVQPNRDLVALGVANLVSGLLRGTPVGAGYSATAANEAVGSQSRLAGLSAAAVVFVVVLLGLPLIERIPRPVLAAIVIHAVSKSLRIGVFRNYFRWQRDRLVVVTAVFAVLAFGVLDGLLVAIAFSLVMLLRSLASPRLSVLGRVGEHDYVSLARYPNAASVAGMLVLRPEEPLFFANAEPLLVSAREQVLRAPGTTLVVLSLEESPDLDTTSIEALHEFCSWLAERNVAIRLARLKEDSREALQRARLTQVPATALDYSSVDDAVRGVRTGGV